MNIFCKIWIFFCKIWISFLQNLNIFFAKSEYFFAKSEISWIQDGDFPRSVPLPLRRDGRGQADSAASSLSSSSSAPPPSPSKSSHHTYLSLFLFHVLSLCWLLFSGSITSTLSPPSGPYEGRGPMITPPATPPWHMLPSRWLERSVARVSWVVLSCIQCPWFNDISLHDPSPDRRPSHLHIQSTVLPPHRPSRSTAQESGETTLHYTRWAFLILPTLGKNWAWASQKATNASSLARAGRRCWWESSAPWPAPPAPRGWTRQGTARQARRQVQLGSVCTRANLRREKPLTRPSPHLYHLLCLPRIDWRCKILWQFQGGIKNARWSPWAPSSWPPSWWWCCSGSEVSPHSRPDQHTLSEPTNGAHDHPQVLDDDYVDHAV